MSDLSEIERRYKAEIAYAAEAEKEAPKLGDLLMAVSKEIERPEPWIATGIEPLDRMLDGGLRRGEVFVIAARPRVGKSACALQIILHMAGQGTPVALWSLEMRPKQWIRRAVASLSGIHPKSLRTGTVPDHELDGFIRASQVIHAMPLHFAVGESDPAGWRKEAHRQVMNGAKVLVVDYLQLMDAPPGEPIRERQVAITSKGLKRFANDYAVSIVLLAQLRRDAEGKVPTLADLRESGAIEQDADEVFFLHRDMEPEANTLLYTGLGILAKNRDGETGAFGLRYDPRSYRFEPHERASSDDWKVKARRRA